MLSTDAPNPVEVDSGVIHSYTTWGSTLAVQYVSLPSADLLDV